MKKLLIIPIAAACLLGVGAGVIASKNSNVALGEDSDVVYYADFEGKVVTSTVPPDKVTDFIWAQEYLDCKTETHDGSNMLYMKAATKSNDFSTLGGFGTGSKSNLAKCREGEPYIVETYLDMYNMDFVEVEACCGDNKWGAARIYKDGKIYSDVGGNNMTDVTYKNKRLSFKFTYTYNANAGMNGYITFKAFNSNNGYAYIDDCKISHSSSFIEGTFEEYPVGVFDGADDTKYHTIIYSGISKTIIRDTEIVNENNNNKLRVSYDATTTSEAESVFYFNKLQFLNIDREVVFSFDVKTTNISKLYMRYGGPWIQDVQEVSIDLGTGNCTKTGNKMLDITYVNNKVTLKFKTGSLDGKTAESYQLLVSALATNVAKATIDVDNTKFVQIPQLSGISVNTGTAKLNYAFGDSFSSEGLVIIGTNTDGTLCTIPASDCSYSGYNMNSEGRQTVTVTYLTFSSTYQITVARVLSRINIDTTNVKKAYGYGEKFDLTGLVVTATYEDGGEEVTLVNDALKLNGYAVFAGGFDSTKKGQYVVEIIYKNKKATFTVTVDFEETYDFSGNSYSDVGGK